MGGWALLREKKEGTGVETHLIFLTVSLELVLTTGSHSSQALSVLQTWIGTPSPIDVN